jgi:hypothetical protein
MPRKYLAFDIETAKVIPESVRDWMAQRPLGISCAATRAADAQQATLWHGVTGDGRSADRMGQDDAAELVRHLQQSVADGYTILTWNGLGFDFDILAEESGMTRECAELASGHVDMMFHVLCEKGFGVGLEAAAQGMNLPGKTAGMSGILAPQMWARQQRQEVLDYVAQDVQTTLQLATCCEQQRRLCWISGSGRQQVMPLPKGWLTVAAATQLPEPDTSWMSKPWPRSRSFGWMTRAKNVPGA